MRKQPQENTGRVVVLATGFFGVLALAAWLRGVFSGMAPETLAAAAIFTIASAVATYALDESVRSWVNAGLARRRRRPSVRKAPAKSPAARRAAT